MQEFSDWFMTFLYRLPFFAILLVALFIGKIVYQKTTRFHFDDELTEKDNPAFGVHLALYLLGLMIALGGTVYGGVSFDSIYYLALFLFCMLSIVLMRLSVLINDKVILGKFSIEKEMIQDRNVGTGFVVGGSCIATGLVINGSLSGESVGTNLIEWLTRACLDVCIYFAVGQVVLIIGAKVFESIIRYDIHKSIEEDDNMAAGISFGGYLVALGIIMRSALVGATSNLGIELLITLCVALIGIVLLILARLATDKLLLPKSPLSKEVAIDKNPAAAVIAAVSFICIALAFSWTALA